MEGKICSLPFKLVTSTGVTSPLLAPVEWSENAGIFEKSHTTVDLDRITKIGVLTQISTNNSVNKILFFEQECITFIASAYGWSVAEPNIKDDLKGNKYYNYKEYPVAPGKVIVGFNYGESSYGKNRTLVDFEPLFWACE